MLIRMIKLFWSKGYSIMSHKHVHNNCWQKGKWRDDNVRTKHFNVEENESKLESFYQNV